MRNKNLELYEIKQLEAKLTFETSKLGNSAFIQNNIFQIDFTDLENMRRGLKCFADIISPDPDVVIPPIYDLDSEETILGEKMSKNIKKDFYTYNHEERIYILNHISTLIGHRIVILGGVLAYQKLFKNKYVFNIKGNYQKKGFKQIILIKLKVCEKLNEEELFSLKKEVNYDLYKLQQKKYHFDLSVNSYKYFGEEIAGFSALSEDIKDECLFNRDYIQNNPKEFGECFVEIDKRLKKHLFDENNKTNKTLLNKEFSLDGNANYSGWSDNYFVPEKVRIVQNFFSELLGTIEGCEDCIVYDPNDNKDSLLSFQEIIDKFIYDVSSDNELINCYFVTKNKLFNFFYCIDSALYHWGYYNIKILGFDLKNSRINIKIVENEKPL